MKKYISIKELLEKAEQKGVDFGKGDPYNRLRYYTKIGWIPHMTRKKGDKGSTKGHYPVETVDRLILIQKLKDQGLTNEEITKKIQIKERVQNFYKLIKSDHIRNKAITYGSFLMLLFILLAELGYIKINRPSNHLIIQSNDIQANLEIIESGSAFIPENESEVLITSDAVFENSKIYVSFKDNYSPATRFWVEEQIDGEGFRLRLDVPTANNAEFDWWVSN